MLELQPNECGFFGTILLDAKPGAGLAVTLFAASATENRIHGLPGFRGAAFLASLENDHLLELVVWESAAALGAMQSDHRFSDHIAVLNAHAKHHHVAFSPTITLPAPFKVERGELVSATLSLLPDRSVDDVNATLRQLPGAPSNRLHHTTPAKNGVHVFTYVCGTSPFDLGGYGASSLWSSRFEVIDAFRADAAALNRNVSYRILAHEAQAQAAAHA